MHFRAALDMGINFFDTADMYSRGRSEEVTGKLLGEMASREEIIIASKVFFPIAEGKNRRGLSRKHVLEACDASLLRLGVDYIDLYQIHRWDPFTPIEETLDALDSLVRSGKVRYLGASSMAGWQMAKALFTSRIHGWHGFVSMQTHFNLVYREEEREMIPLCLDQKVAVLPWSPLARGFLTGSRTPGNPHATRRAQSDDFADKLYFRDDDYRVLDALLKISKQRGDTPAQIALAWLLSSPAVTAPIVGATQTTHLEEAVKAVDITLTHDEIKQLEKPYVPHPVLGHVQPGAREGAAF